MKNVKASKRLLFIFVFIFSFILCAPAYASSITITSPANDQDFDSTSFEISGTLNITPNPSSDAIHYVRLYVNGDNNYLPNNGGSKYPYSTETDSAGNWSYTVQSGSVPCGIPLEITAAELTETAYIADTLTLPSGPGYFNYLPIMGSTLGAQSSIAGPAGGIDIIKTTEDGRYAFVAYFNLFDLENRLSVVDTTTNTEVANILLEGSISSLATVTAISADGNTLFIYDSIESATDFTILKIFSVDISDPTAPSLSGSTPFTAYTALDNEQVPTTNIAGDYAYLPHSDREVIEVYDVSSGPAGNPVLAGSYSIGTTTLGLRHFSAVHPDGNSITFVNQDSTDVEAGLYTFDISSDPLLASSTPSFTAVPEGPNAGLYTPDGSRYLLSRGNSSGGDDDELVLFDSGFSIIDVTSLPDSISADTIGIVLNTTGSDTSVNTGCLLAELANTGTPATFQILFGILLAYSAYHFGFVTRRKIYSIMQ